MSNTKRARRPSLFEQARNAKPRTESYFIPLVEKDEADRLWRDLDETRAAARRAVLFDEDSKAKVAADEAHAAAQRAFDEAFRKVSFRGLAPRDLDALTNEHPDPADGEDPPEGHVPFIYRLAVASQAEDYGVTAEQWRELCEDVWPAAEGNAFRQAVLNANQLPYSAGLGKES